MDDKTHDMEIRDTFAAYAMQAMLAEQYAINEKKITLIAGYAYDVADAMMEEKAKRDHGEYLEFEKKMEEALDGLAPHNKK